MTLTTKGAATRDRIVSTTSELVWERGVARVSIADVQASAGVSAAQLYHYFADREDLVHAVVERQSAMVMGAQRAALDGWDSFEALVAWRNQVVGIVRSLGCAGGCPLGSLASELADVDETARAAIERSYAEWEALLRIGLRAMKRRGELRKDADPARLALALLAAVQGGLLLSKARRDTKALEAALDAMIDHVRSYAA